MNKMYCLAFACALTGTVLVDLATAQPGTDPTHTANVAASPGPIGTLYKTPPMRTSETIQINMLTHIPPTAPMGNLGWAGATYIVHVADSTEVDVVSIEGLQQPDPPALPYPILYPFGPASGPYTSMSRVGEYYNMIDSGVDYMPSQVFPVSNIKLHAKNTNLGQNSDIDLTVFLANIYHARSTFLENSEDYIIHIPQSVSVWARSTFGPFQPSETPPPYQPPQYPPWQPDGPYESKWVHLYHPIERVIHGAGTTFPGSTYIRTGYLPNGQPPAGIIRIGIEHVPEPTSLVLFGLSLACAVMGVRSRMSR